MRQSCSVYIWVVIGIVVLLGFCMWRPKKEGLENNDVGLYDYLAPAKAASGSGSFDGKHKWSDETVKQLTEKYMNLLMN
jgi:hypothetical protein